MIHESRHQSVEKLERKSESSQIFGERPKRETREVDGAPSVEERRRINMAKGERRTRRGVGLTLIALVTFTLSPFAVYMFQLGRGLSGSVSLFAGLTLSIIAVAVYLSVTSNKRQRFNSFRGGVALGVLIVGYAVFMTIFIASTGS